MVQDKSKALRAKYTRKKGVTRPKLPCQVKIENQLAFPFTTINFKGCR